MMPSGTTFTESCQAEGRVTPDCTGKMKCLIHMLLCMLLLPMTVSTHERYRDGPSAHATKAASPVFLLLYIVAMTAVVYPCIQCIVVVSPHA